MIKNKILIEGIRDGLPIGAGYFAVAFSLGIIAAKADLSSWQGFISSFFTRASAGEYGVYCSIAAKAGVVEIILITLIANVRYLLMGAALTQKLDPKMPLWKRVVAACCITDEVFGISIAFKDKYLKMSYPLGATLVAGTMWAAGTAFGITAGNILPNNIVTALNVALYGMFIAVIIPPCRNDSNLLYVVIISFIVSYSCSLILPVSSGTRTIILTIIISAIAAYIKPVRKDE